MTPDLLDDRSPALLSATCPDRIDWIHPEQVLIADCRPHPINGHMELNAKSSFFHYFDEPEPLQVLNLMGAGEDSENIPVGVEIEAGTGTDTDTELGLGLGLPSITMAALPEVSIDMNALNATYDTLKSGVHTVLSISDELFRPSFGLFRSSFGSVSESASVTLVGLSQDGQTCQTDQTGQTGQTQSMNGGISTTNSSIPSAQLVPTSTASINTTTSTSIGIAALGLLQHPINDIDEYKHCIKIDYEISHIIRTVLIPNAVGWYTGELMVVDE